MGRPQGIKVCQFQMHSGFFPEAETLIHLDKSELDDLPDGEHIPMNFSVSLPIAVSSTERPPAPTSVPWLTSKKTTRSASILFGSPLEYEENVDNFSKFFVFNEWVSAKNLLAEKNINFFSIGLCFFGRRFFCQILFGRISFFLTLVYF